MWLTKSIEYLQCIHESWFVDGRGSMMSSGKYHGCPDAELVCVCGVKEARRKRPDRGSPHALRRDDCRGYRERCHCSLHGHRVHLHVLFVVPWRSQAVADGREARTRAASHLHVTSNQHHLGRSLEI
jgi:hypothetical protein